MRLQIGTIFRQKSIRNSLRLSVLQIVILRTKVRFNAFIYPENSDNRHKRYLVEMPLRKVPLDRSAPILIAPDVDPVENL